jgi:hypothetical protein
MDTENKKPNKINALNYFWKCAIDARLLITVCKYFALVTVCFS